MTQPRSGCAAQRRRAFTVITSMATCIPVPPVRPPRQPVGYGEHVYRARITMLTSSADKPTRTYTGIGPVSIVPTTHNLATLERRKNEKLGALIVDVIGHRPETSTVEVYNLSTHKKRVVHFNP